MNDRKALAAAFTLWDQQAPQPETLHDYAAAHDLIIAAAREHLAQLPEKCPECGDVDWQEPSAVYLDPCPTCHSSGKVYPAELVERITDVLEELWRSSYLEITVAILDALNERTTP